MSLLAIPVLPTFPTATASFGDTDVVYKFLGAWFSLYGFSGSRTILMTLGDSVGGRVLPEYDGFVIASNTNTNRELLSDRGPTLVGPCTVTLRNGGSPEFSSGEAVYIMLFLET